MKPGDIDADSKLAKTGSILEQMAAERCSPGRESGVIDGQEK